MKIAIRGNYKEANKIIKLLESLGGKNRYDLVGNCSTSYYFINSNNYIVDKDKFTIDKNYKLYESIEEYEQSLLTINYTDI